MKTNLIQTYKVDHPDFYRKIDQLFIDGIQLGSLIDQHLDYSGSSLIPSLSCENTDRYFLWKILESDEIDEFSFPILICSEGDFSCFEHMVFVYLKKEKEYINWMKLGVLYNPQQYWEKIDRSSDVMRCSTSIDDIDSSEIKWIKNIGSFKFKRSEYEELINYFRITNKRIEKIEKISDWLHLVTVQNRFNKPFKYLHLCVVIENEISIKLFGSKYQLNNDLNQNETKIKNNKLSLGNCEKIISLDEIVEILRLQVNKIMARENRYTLINYSSEVFIRTPSHNIISVKNKNIAKKKNTIWRMINLLIDKLNF